MVTSIIKKDVYLDYEYKDISWFIYVDSNCNCETKGKFWTKVNDYSIVKETELNLIKKATRHEYLHIIYEDIKTSLNKMILSIHNIYKYFIKKYKKEDLDEVYKWFEKNKKVFRYDAW